MNRLKNENGSTLIIVLLVLVIFTISVSLLSFQINNMSAQFKKTEAVIEAKHLADMGEEYYKAYVNKKVQDAPDSVDLTFLKDQLKTPFMSSEEGMKIDSESNSSFKIRPLEISKVEGVDIFIIEYEIIGTVGTEVAVNNSKIEIKIETEIVIN
ncbi:hypothetical protein BW721_01270 [Jeotgalibaca sp. PTS2502]|uniref:hypothetical protein n=1 Tax=Jeotgalibaca sp. PTS2502 TaxID=1903686 RepID=UPI000973A287|nr:hypothetical protein [Jeotgalibaca sp. PTS2502]APZ48432.1 hypothetical protein BW721_01270 [Jeotgalibaca sp. PTS2502]